MTGQGLLMAANELIAEASGRDPWLAALRLEGVGWATVELERAAAELAAAFTGAGLPAPAWAPAPRDDLLGATAWVSREWWPTWGHGEPPSVVLLEPDTEGRLAAALARAGEGVAVVYLRRRADGPALDTARLGSAAGGPLGPAHLLLARPAWGPHVVVLGRPTMPAPGSPGPESTEARS